MVEVCLYIHKGSTDMEKCQYKCKKKKKSWILESIYISIFMEMEPQTVRMELLDGELQMAPTLKKKKNQ